MEKDTRPRVSLRRYLVTGNNSLSTKYTVDIIKNYGVFHRVMSTGVIPIFPRVTHREQEKTPLQIGNSQGFGENRPILGESYKDYRGLTENRLKLQLSRENPVTLPLGIYREHRPVAQVVG